MGNVKTGSVSILILTSLAASIVAACSHSEYAAPSSYTVSNEAVVKTVENALGDGRPSGATKLAGAASAACTGETSCKVYYAVEESTGIDNDIELVQPTRQIWKTLFADPSFETGTITVTGPTTSVGGVQHMSTLFELTCDRNVISQIDWDNIDAHGLKALCTYTPKVNGM
ncbi:hypothetical protein [Mycobacterium sp. HM-7]